MRYMGFHIWMGFFLMIAGTAQAQELAPRKDMGAVDRAKVHTVMSKRWLGFGVTERTMDTPMAPGTIGAKSSCTVNIGTPAEQTGRSSGRYGPNPNKDNIVVVTGDVISVCK